MTELIWYQEGKCERCIYYEVVDETEEEEDIFCNSPKIDINKNWSMEQCDFRTRRRKGEVIKCFDDHFLHASDFGL